jgi:anti-sigma factor RsiW
MPYDPDTRPAMDCAELSRSAEAMLDGEFDEREQAEASAHLAACEACRRTLEGLSRKREAVRSKLREAMGPGSPHGRAPASLRASVTQALRRQRRPWRVWLSPLPIAAAAACAAGALLVVYTRGGDDWLAEEVAAKHSRSLPLEVTAASVGPDSVAGWFKGKVDFNTRPPEFRQAGVRLLGARISNIKDQPAAYMRYELPHGQMGLFIVEDRDRRLPSAGREVHVGPATIRLVNARGYNVAVWRNDEIVYSLVSDLGEPDLEKLVEAALAAQR